MDFSWLQQPKGLWLKLSLSLSLSGKTEGKITVGDQLAQVTDYLSNMNKIPTTHPDSIICGAGSSKITQIFYIIGHIKRSTSSLALE